MPFEQAREQISERVFTDKRKAEFQKYLQKLRAQAIIEWKNEDVKKAFEEGIEAAGGRRRRSDGSRAGAQWFAIWTRSRHEQVVREQLERKQIDAFLPTITRWSRWKDRKKKIDWPLFPGYCFARFDPDDALPILKCTGVVNIVSFDGKPAPIPEYELDSIRAARRQRAAVRSVPDDSRRHDGRSRCTVRCEASSAGWCGRTRRRRGWCCRSI